LCRSAQVHHCQRCRRQRAPSQRLAVGDLRAALVIATMFELSAQHKGATNDSRLPPARRQVTARRAHSDRACQTGTALRGESFALRDLAADELRPCHLQRAWHSRCYLAGP
jgi:hypothetical protein